MEEGSRTGCAHEGGGALVRFECLDAPDLRHRFHVVARRLGRRVAARLGNHRAAAFRGLLACGTAGRKTLRPRQNQGATRPAGPRRRHRQGDPRVSEPRALEGGGDAAGRAVDEPSSTRAAEEQEHAAADANPDDRARPLLGRRSRRRRAAVRRTRAAVPSRARRDRGVRPEGRSRPAVARDRAGSRRGHQVGFRQAGLHPVGTPRSRRDLAATSARLRSRSLAFPLGELKDGRSERHSHGKVAP
jgi:hypothetical protein